MSPYRVFERWLDGRLQAETFAARWHLGIALVCIVTGVVGAIYHGWACHRHRRAARHFGSAPCRHVPPR